MSPARPVDEAMDALRPEKVFIRGLWAEEVESVARMYPESRVPWFLTLPGKDGLDIKDLIDRGIIGLSENRSIGEDYLDKIVAVERSTSAVIHLNRQFAGLNIRQVDFSNLVRGEGKLSWPEGKDIGYCRARVINLDLHSPLKAVISDNEIIFPLFEWVRKLCRIHSVEERIPWTLCLTLHAEFSWSEAISQRITTLIRNFVQDNKQQVPEFEVPYNEFIGDQLFATQAGEELDLGQIEMGLERRFIMVIVPKFIASIALEDGWTVETAYNLQYRGAGGAPMATWILRFSWQEDLATRRHQNYTQSLESIFSRIGEVRENEIVGLA